MQSSLVSTLAVVNAALRSSEAQGLLAELASMPNISLVASMDHVNTPLLWDKQMAARFDWLYFDVTNYTPYYLKQPMYLLFWLAGGKLVFVFMQLISCLLVPCRIADCLAAYQYRTS